MTWRSAGFTLVELVTVIVVIGVMTATVIPNLNIDGFRGVAFHDRVVSSLRYAGRLASSHRRQVCVDFTAETLALTIDANRDNDCEAPINFAEQDGNVLQSGNAAIVFTPVPGQLVFQPDGSSVDAQLSINNDLQITVVGRTGHVF